MMMTKASTALLHTRALALLLGVVLLVVASPLHALNAPQKLDAANVLSFMLVNGRVTTTSARVLYDVIPVEEAAAKLSDNDAPRQTLAYTLTEQGSSGDAPAVPKATGSLSLRILPAVLKLDSLEPCKQYTLSVTGSNGVVLGTSRISTKCPGRSSAMEAIVVSCDRYLEDHDDEFVRLLDKNLTGAETVFHIGDQHYLDLPRKALANVAFPEAYDHVRRLYHKSWTRPAMASVLRKGSHLMLPDDHDIFNALSPGVLKTHKVDTAFIKAAHLAVLLFQRQLSRDVDIDVPLLLQGKVGDETLFSHTRVYDSFVENGVGVFLLDLRYHRAFDEGHDEEPCLVGARQMRDFTAAMDAWRQDSGVTSILVLSNLPLLYPSTPLADLVKAVENDLYPNHRSYHASEHALLQPLFRAARAKPCTVAAGDLHMAAEITMCHRDTSKAEGPGEEGARTCVPSYVSSSITKGSEGIRGLIITLFDGLVLRMPHPSFSVDGHHYSAHFHSMKLLNNFLRLSIPSSGEQPRATFTIRQHNPAFTLYHDMMLYWGTPALLVTIAYLLFRCLAACVRSCCCGPSRSTARPHAKTD